MSLRLFFAALAIILASTSSDVAHATTFDVHGTMQTLPVTGTIDIDTNTGLVTAADVAAGFYSFPILYYQANFLVFGFYSNQYYAFVRSTNSPSSYYSIIAIETAQNPGSLVGYTGGPFAAFIGYEASGVGGYQGTLTLPVPGPTVGAGLPGLLMAIAGLIGWRRSRRAIATEMSSVGLLRGRRVPEYRLLDADTSNRGNRFNLAVQSTSDSLLLRVYVG